MIIENLIDFKNSLIKGKRLIGLDIGKNTIGIAISDRDWSIATPKFTIIRKNTEKDINIIIDYIKENNVCGIVSGLPLNSKNEETKCSQIIRKFIEILQKKINMPIYFNNEVLTSFAAEDFLIDTMLTKFTKTKQIVDKVAAHYILQEVLNKI